MGFIRERKTKNGGTRYQVEIRLKGKPMQTAVFDRRSDAKAWMHKIEADMRAGRHQLYAASRRHTFKEAVERYFKEQAVSVVKRGHLLWWQKELGSLYLQDIRPALIIEKKQKLLTEPTAKGVVRSGSTCNRFLASLSHLMSICVNQWELLLDNPVKRIFREKEPRERTRFLNQEDRQRLLEACKQSDSRCSPPFAIKPEKFI